ncbi:LamG domain-containing protein [Kutzneria buriramensis]|uniref:Concanavalin A-like lectin/glucanase superfamily protein n=1 Tax=Kutzneria buriramensis TaxID=1045776 RepID=A0A3E0GZ58_9PSEU|nr:LamG domain-containing protein [Kutzneria buriramensis]REH35226.1 concanavalin A-like lectin/glucanase superfamily protein [Kutzneria buriramensis]
MAVVGLPRALFRVRVLLGAAALAAGSLLTPVAAAPASAAAIPDQAPTETQAQQYARQGHKNVLVTSRLSETEEVSAQPDGSLVWRQYTRPVRVRRGNQWVPVDTTLAVRPDGSIGPKASTLDISLSAGGPGSAARPLVKLGNKGAEVGLTWTGDLPRPTLDGATATYPEVWPGVDLAVTADSMGFSEVLVVKTAEAAKNPKLSRITFGTYTSNTQVRARAQAAPGGDLQVVDASGAEVFAGDATRMWDSSGQGSKAEQVTGGADGARRAGMRADVTPTGVDVSPDQAFLADKGTHFPVYIDPEYFCSNTSWCGMQHHVVVQSGYPDAHNFDATGGSLGELLTGYENSDPAHISRSYLQMNTAPIIGKSIHWAHLNTTVTHTWNCSGTTDSELWWTGGIGGGTTWNAQPGWNQKISTANVANCHDAGNVTQVFEASDIVRRAAAEGWQAGTFMIKSTVENSVSGWRKFGLNPYLEVAYDSPPNNPTNHAMANGALPCVKGDNRPWVDTQQPEVQATVSDPDGGSLSVQVATSGGTYGHDTPNSYHDNAANRFWVGTPGPNQGATAQYTIPDGWIGGDGIYKWAMKVGDGELDSPRWDWDCEFTVDTAVPKAPTVALTGQQPQLQGDPVTFSVSVPLANAGLDDIDRFVFTTDGSDPSVQGSPVANRNPGLDANGNVTATVNATAVNGNQNLIRVKAVSKTNKPGPNGACVAGNGLDAAACAYIVQPLTPEKGLAGAWALDDAGGTTGADNVAAIRSDATPHPVTLNGDATWSLGYSRGNGWTQPDQNGSKDGVKGGLVFNRTGYLATAGPVLDTTKSFTISAWAMLADASPNSYHAVIAQDGNVNSGAFIEYSSDAATWTFNLPSTDTTSPYNPRVAAKAPPQMNVWTHLTGTYDGETGLATLYVNGAKQNSLVRKGYASNGPLTIGGLQWNGARASLFAGFIDDAQVWQRVLSDAEVHALATAGVPRAQYGLGEGAASLLTTGSTNDGGNFTPAPVPSLQGYWKLDEGSGTTAADVGNSGSGLAPHPLTLSGGTSWVPGKSGTAVHLDGTGYGQTSGPVVDTSRSFTVSAWAKLDDVNGYYGVAGQPAKPGGVPGFLMRYSPDVKAWIFGVNSTPQDDHAAAQMNWTYRPNSVTTAGDWTLVTGVFNSETKKLQMYVNGKLTGDTAFGGAPWTAGGPLTVGGYDIGGITHQFKGSLDQVQVWQQALSASQIAGLAGQSFQDAVWNVNGNTAPGTPSGSVSEVADQRDAADAQFNYNATVGLQRPDTFRTDNSFTVEAWVRLDAPDGDDNTRAVAAMDDASGYSPFMFGYRKDTQPVGKWAFGLSCDQHQACLNFAWSDAKADRGAWTHLAATFDRAANTVCLYVNGQRQSTCATATAPYNGSGSLRLGAGQWNGGSLVDNWYGGIAGFRVYSGVRTPDQIKGDRTVDDPGNLFGVKH